MEIPDPKDLVVQETFTLCEICGKRPAVYFPDGNHRPFRCLKCDGELKALGE